MKVLTTEQQEDLQQLFEYLSENPPTQQEMHQIGYWAIELKPKRVRKKVQEGVDNPVE